LRPIFFSTPRWVWSFDINRCISACFLIVKPLVCSLWGSVSVHMCILPTVHYPTYKKGQSHCIFVSPYWRPLALLWHYHVTPCCWVTMTEHHLLMHFCLLIACHCTRM
jgi:hypothetical protein